MNKEQIVKQLRNMAKHPTVTLPRDCEALKSAADMIEQAQKQEPVAMQMDVIVVNLVREGINKHRARELAEHFTKHTSPPQRQPLTDEQIGTIATESQWGFSPHDDTLRFARAIEAAHGITGEQK